MAPAILQSRREAAQEKRQLAFENPVLKQDEAAQINIGAALTLVGVIIGAVVGIQVLAALAPTWFDATGDLSENFTNADVGDPQANALANGVFPFIIALVGVFAIVGLAFGVMKLRGS